MHCTNCGTGVEPGTNFCTKCGSRLTPTPGISGNARAEPSRLDAVCAGLILELDSARQNWLALVNDFMSSSADDGLSIVNSEFSETAEIGALGDDEPTSFVFATLNGVSAEATVIAWQIESVVGFATSQKYIREDQGQELLTVLTKTLSPVPSARWILAMQMVLASFQKSVMIDDEDMAIVLSHFFMNERGRTPGVLQLHEKLSSLITFLQGFTYLGTARVFGDVETVKRIQKTLGL
jgi:zinc-ribbon domain